MENSRKNFFIEASLIIGFTIVVAIIYNTLNPNGLNLLRKPPVVQDTLLAKLLSTPVNHSNHIEKKQNLEQQDFATNNTTKPNSNSNEIVNTQASNSPESSPIKESRTEFVEITYSQLIKYLEHPNLILIDARNAEDFARGHIGKAINIFAYEEDINQYFKALTTIPMDESKVIIVYCDGGTCDASHKVATDLIRLGHKNVFVYSGGWEEWSNIQKKQQ